MTLTSYKEQVTQYGVAVLKNQNTEFIEAFNRGLATLKANGEYDKIINKYIGTDDSTTASTEDTSLLGLLKTQLEAQAEPNLCQLVLSHSGWYAGEACSLRSASFLLP